MGCHFLLQGIFPTQGSNLHPLHLLHCRRIPYCWAIREAHKKIASCKSKNPTIAHGILQARILEWEYSPGDLPNPGIEPSIPYYRWILYQLSHKGSPRMLEWVAYPFSSGSSWPRNQIWACIAGGFFTNWAMREAPERIFQFLLVPVYLPKRRKGSESIITGLHISE